MDDAIEIEQKFHIIHHNIVSNLQIHFKRLESYSRRSVRCDTHLYIYNDFVTTIMLPRFVDNLV